MADIEVVDNFSNPLWRLNNLYRIIDDSGRDIPFSMNNMQETFYNEMWYRNTILKGRQNGFTTLLCIVLLDAAVFYPNTTCGIIALTLDDVKKIFRRKIKHPYEKLPASVKQQVRPTNDTQNELIFSNDSDISVDTGFRGGTYNYLLISEFGKIASVYPEKAVEIKVGSFNTVHADNYIFVESTGHGKGGEFYELCKASKDTATAGKSLTKLDFKYHFYPWWMNDKYQLPTSDAVNVVFTRKNIDYLDRVERRIGRRLSLEQRAWYVTQLKYNGEEILREFPSIDSEPFEAVLKGAILGEEMALARAEGRIGKFKHDRGLAVDTWWDIGRRDKTAIWFLQTIGNEMRFIWYHEESFKGLPYFLTLCNTLRTDLHFNYRYHLGPHDMAVTEYGSDRTRFESAKALGYTFQIGRQFDQVDQISATRAMLGNCYFDEENCSEGITHLEMARREWSEHTQSFQQTVLHNDHCFTPDTLVQTSRGPRRMDQLDGTDEVLTPCGFRPYHPARQTRANAQLVEVTFSDGSTVKCTPEHLFLTAYGWRSAESLPMGSSIQSCSTQLPSISRGRFSSVGLAAHISLGAQETRRSIARFGQGLLDRFHLTVTSITAMESPSTTPSQTSNVFRRESIYQSHHANGSGQLKQANFSPPASLIGSRSGIARTPLKYGTSAPKIELPHGQSNGEYQSSAFIAASNLWGSIAPECEQQNTAETNADTPPTGLGNIPAPNSLGQHTYSPARRSLALNAVWRFLQWSDLAPQVKSTAPVSAVRLRIRSVKPLNYRANVWCINVPDGHWFCLANGAVVHNSHGLSSFMNGAMMNGFLQKGRPRARTVQNVQYPT